MMSDEKKLLFVVNPHSGRGAVKAHLMEIVNTFSTQGYLTTVCPTQRSGQANEIIARFGGEYDRIVASGGDGSVNEAVNGLMQLDRRVPLGIMPMGTTNDYAYTLGIPNDPVKAAETAVTGTPRDIDLGLFNGRYFTYVAAFGIFTDVCYETPQNLKNALGGVAYALEGIKKAQDLHTEYITISYDGGVIMDEFLAALITNTVSVAGMRTALEGASLDDGLLDVTLIRPPKTLADIQTIINILTDFEHLTTVNNSFLTHFTTTHARITSDTPVKWTLDGENGGALTEAEISNVHLAATVITGNTTRIE